MENNFYKLLCEDLIKDSGIDPKSFACCSSCHEDDELGYDMCDVDLRGMHYYVCCSVAQRINEFFDEKEEHFRNKKILSNFSEALKIAWSNGGD